MLSGQHCRWWLIICLKCQSDVTCTSVWELQSSGCCIFLFFKFPVIKREDFGRKDIIQVCEKHSDGIYVDSANGRSAHSCCQGTGGKYSPSLWERLTERVITLFLSDKHEYEREREEEEEDLESRCDHKFICVSEKWAFSVFHTHWGGMASVTDLLRSCCLFAWVLVT